MAQALADNSERVPAVGKEILRLGTRANPFYLRPRRLRRAGIRRVETEAGRRAHESLGIVGLAGLGPRFATGHPFGA